MNLQSDSGTDWEGGTSAVKQQCLRKARAGELSGSTAARYLRIFESFSRYAQACGSLAPDDVTAGMCWHFLTAPLRGDQQPEVATSALRLAAVRDAFAVLVAVGAAAENPTEHLRVDRILTTGLPCPLTPAEARRVSTAGRLSATDTLRPAAVVLALAGATHGEIANAALSDVDLTTCRLRLGRAPRERTVSLTADSVSVLAAQVAAQRRKWRRMRLPWSPETVPLAMHRSTATYRADSVAPTVSMNLSRALARAGVTRPGVRPRSLREYAANAVYARSGRVEDVAA